MRKDASGRDRSKADAFWCKLSAVRGHSVGEIEFQLLSVSEKAREELAAGNETYARQKAEWGMKAARR
jgi:hypothetical protein